MLLSDIMKPLKGEIKDSPRFSGEMSIFDAEVKALPPSCDTLYVMDSAGEVCGRINRDVLEYLVRQNRNAMLAEIMNKADEGLIAIDEEGRVFYLNRTYSRLLGVPAGKILGRKIQEIEPAASLIKVLESRQSMKRTRQHIRTVDRYVSVRMYPLFISGVFKGAYSLFKDVTELNSLNNEISRITKVAEEYNLQLLAKDALADLEIVGEDPHFKNMLAKSMIVAQTDVTVLIRGENGSGKELMARLIHNNSLRKDKPFIAINCAAIPETLIESELFGYEEGAFTDAKKEGHVGKFELADKGTIFLDEVGDMPLSMQSKLLRVLQEGEIQRIGARAANRVDVRVIAATNQPLEEMLEKKQFREDLFYRFNVMPIDVPPLRRRPHDIFMITNHYLALFNKKYGKNLAISNQVYHLFECYHWPGNVRQLRNAVEHAVILCTTGVINRDELPSDIWENQTNRDDSEGQRPGQAPQPLRQAVQAYERQLLLDALRYAKGNKSQAMANLGLSRRTFYRKLSDYDIH